MTDSELLSKIVEERTRKPASGYGPLLLLVVSAALFVSMGVLRWELSFVLMLLLAVFVHEAGHVLAMRIFKYKNLKMLFLPLIGGMAAGEPDDLDSLKIAAISIAGPIAGLAGGAVSTALWLWSGHDLFLSFAWVSLALNAFNLLPLVPLDGGHFVNELLLSRHPRAELVFKLFAMAALGAIIVATGLYILGIVIVLMLTTLRSGYRMATEVVALRTEPGLAGGALTEAKVGLLKAAIGRVNPQALMDKNRPRLPAQIWETWIRVKKLFPPPRKVVLMMLLYLALFFGLLPLSLAFLTGMQRERAGGPVEKSAMSGPADDPVR